MPAPPLLPHPRLSPDVAPARANAVPCLDSNAGRRTATLRYRRSVEPARRRPQRIRHIAARRHPIAARRVIDVDLLASLRWALPPATSSARILFDEFFRLQGRSAPTPYVECESVHSIMDVVATTDLLGIAPLSIARRHAAGKRLKRLKSALELPRISVSAIWRRTSEVDQHAMQFLDALVTAGSKRRRSEAL